MLIKEFKGQKNNIIRFICCDNLDWMKNIDYKYYHLAIPDPPYGIDVTKMNLGKSKEQIAALKRDRGNWDNKIPDQKYFDLLFYISRNQIIWGANYFCKFLDNCKKFYLWDKEQPEGLSFADCEFAWTSFEGAPKIIKRSRMKDVSHEKIHDTQKPIYLYDAMFKDLSEKHELKAGWKVLDTHGGSHNSAIAAYRYHLNLDIIEMQEQHHLTGIKNFEDKCVPRLF